MRITLVDRNEELVEAWRREFEPYPEFEVVCGDIFAVDAGAMVSPANCFGYMDGGLDKAIIDKYGQGVQLHVANIIDFEYSGEMPVGRADTTMLPDGKWLIIAPTMRIPCDVSNTINAYLAFRAILGSEKGGCSACPGLCTGVGKMPVERCARQMRMAYESFMVGRRPNPRDIFQQHVELLR